MSVSRYVYLPFSPVSAFRPPLCMSNVRLLCSDHIPHRMHTILLYWMAVKRNKWIPNISVEIDEAFPCRTHWGIRISLKWGKLVRSGGNGKWKEWHSSLQPPLFRKKKEKPMWRLELRITEKRKKRLNQTSRWMKRRVRGFSIVVITKFVNDTYKSVCIQKGLLKSIFNLLRK